MDLSNFTKSVFTLIASISLPTAEARSRNWFKGTPNNVANPESETDWSFITLIIFVIVFLICCGLNMIKRKRDRAA